jgi:hypothetical protein
MFLLYLIGDLAWVLVKTAFFAWLTTPRPSTASSSQGLSPARREILHLHNRILQTRKETP